MKKRTLSILLSVTLLMSSVSINVFAGEQDQSDQDVLPEEIIVETDDGSDLQKEDISDVEIDDGVDDISVPDQDGNNEESIPEENDHTDDVQETEDAVVIEEDTVADEGNAVIELEPVEEEITDQTITDGMLLTELESYCREEELDVTGIESQHNYSNNMTESDNRWEIGTDWAQEISITFNSSTYVEDNYDYIRIYDQDNKLIGKYTGNALASQTITVTGNKAIITMTSDGSGVRYGFALGSAYAVTQHILDNEQVLKEPTTTSFGEKGRVCLVCGETVITGTTPPLVEYYGTCGSDARWLITEEGELIIQGTGEMYDYDSTTGPWYSQRSKIKSVKVENGLTSIGEYAFDTCYNLTKAELGQDIKEIRYKAFYSCNRLTSVNIPDGVIRLGSLDEWNYFKGSVFEGCGSLTSITISDSVTSIGESTFYRCSSLTGITIPDSVTSIGSNAFRECSGLTGMTIPDSVVWIGSNAFRECSSLTSIIIPDSVTSIHEDAFNGCKSLASVIISNNMTLINEHVFSGCKNLTGVTIPNSVVSIRNGAFEECSSLASVTILEGLISIESFAFSGCSSLARVTIPNSVTSIGTYAFHNCSNLVSVTIPDSVTSIGESAFSGCSSLTSITIPDSVTLIEDSVFKGCSSLTSVTIPDSVTSIGGNAFEGCRSLTSVTIPDSVTLIGWEAFSGCSLLTSITVPDSVTTIKTGAFSGCISLTSVTIPDSVITIEGWTFDGCSNLSSIRLPNRLTSINGYLFHGCSSLENITIPDGVTTIVGRAFEGCSSLTSVIIPDSVISIEGSSFSGCSNLTNVTIPDSVTSIGWGAFEGCSSLTSVTIPDSVTSIGYAAFDGCPIQKTYITSIEAWNAISIGGSDYEFPIGDLYLNGTRVTNLIIPDKINFIRDNAFARCTSITNVTIPDSVTTIGHGAFRGCSSLTSMTIPDSVTTIGWGAFYRCSNLTSVTIPDGVTSIEGGAFCGCSSLTSVTIPDNVTSIGDSAFYGCSSLKNLKIPKNIVSIGESAFYECSSMRSITIPESVTYIGDDAFRYCWNLTDVKLLSNVGRDFTKAKITGEYDQIYSTNSYYWLYHDYDITVNLNNEVVGTDNYDLLDEKSDGIGKSTLYVAGEGQYIGAVKKDYWIYFKDVPMSHSYAKAVYWSVEEGIAAGYTGDKAGYFGVTDDITRGQVVTFLWRAAGKPAPKKTTQSFKDVSTSSGFFNAIQWASEKGITAGYSDKTFRPNEKCTRGQIAMFLWRYQNKPNPKKNTQTFKDVPTSHSFYKAIQWASEQNITSGYKDGTFGPNKTCTRGQCVTFLYRMLK